MSITATVTGSVNATDSRTVGVTSSGTTQKLTANISTALKFSDGSGANQANKLYAATRTLGGSSEDLDLNGVLSDLYGTTISLLRVKGLFVRNNSTSATLTLGNATSNQWATLLNATGTLTLRPGAFVLVGTPDATGWAVTASTGDILKFAGTNGESYDIVVLGASA